MKREEKRLELAEAILAALAAERRVGNASEGVTLAIIWHRDEPEFIAGKKAERQAAFEAAQDATATVWRLLYELAPPKERVPA